MSFMEDFDHLKLELKEIISATENFAHNKLIGRGGFGSVYRGQLSRPQGQIIVACKRLDANFGQGNVEFWKEIMMLSKCKHQNLVSLLYFCIEGDERIIVYEYASHGSLDRYLSDVSLTWTQRLKICIGVARGLNYLHDAKNTQHRVIHRDIKSSNILLDENWVAKVSDFGLSKIGPANQPHTYVFSHAVGTLGYCDPMYWEIGFLSKESDVYSFGVVLFEVLCGTLCCVYDDGGQLKILVPMWRNCFDQNRLDDIIFHGLKEHLDPLSLKTFSTIAYQCLRKTREERPTMAKIMQQLEIALEVQWYWVNKKGEHCELTSAEKCSFKLGKLHIESSTIPVSSSSIMDGESKNFVGEDDLKHISKLVRETDGGPAWIEMMDGSTLKMSYQAWRRDPETGPPQYRSRFVYENMSPEMMRDFLWDDEFRMKWDDKLVEAETIEESPDNGTMVVKWVRKFPFFCNDREYIIGRRIWECGKAYYCVTKGIQYPSIPRRTKPKRVDLYYSSWLIRAAESRNGDGEMSACEVLLFHQEDMGIPFELAKLIVRQGMRGDVKRTYRGLRQYQKDMASGASLSHCANMARINSKISTTHMKLLEITSDDLIEVESCGRTEND